MKEVSVKTLCSYCGGYTTKIPIELPKGSVTKLIKESEQFDFMLENRNKEEKRYICGECMIKTFDKILWQS